MFVGLIVVVAVGLFIFGVARIVVGRRTMQLNEAQTRPQYEAVTDFLSPAERSFFGVLQQAVGSDFIVFAKIRLADIVRPVKNPSRSGWRSAFNRISGKHVDFTLCDPGRLTVLLAVELDDRSHGSLERGFRDNLVDSALSDAGIPILRVPARHSYAPMQVREKINTLLGHSAELLSAPGVVAPTNDDSRYMPKT